MHRIIRTALASLGAAVVVAGGSLGVASATAPAAAPTQTSSSDADQVAALDKQADDLLAKIATLEKELAATPTASPSPDKLSKQELVEPTSQPVYPTAQVTRRASAAPSQGSSSSSERPDQQDPSNGSTND